ncbi:unnamed protein product [Moneuplotes crassus]|uniref:Uncharacterized protein n=1 Tax=Euplotes crassus TaxID=5936 RepID=A0AAD1U1N9_EUPCR|nr:unnamed protein product [Moneuplotes crassus]
MKSQLSPQRKVRVTAIESKIEKVCQLFGNFREASELRKAYKKLAVIPKKLAKMNLVCTQPSSDLSKMCKQINPKLFEKDITIEDIHEEKQKSRNFDSIDNENLDSDSKLEKQYSVDLRGFSEVKKKRIAQNEQLVNGRNSSVMNLESAGTSSGLIKFNKDYYNLLMKQNKRGFYPPKASRIQNICVGTKTLKFNEMNREKTLKSLKRSNKKSYYALLKKEFQNGLKRMSRNSNNGRQNTKDLRNNMSVLSNHKKSKQLKSRSESVEKLIRNKTIKLKKNFYKPCASILTINQVHLPYINYETGYSEKNPEFRRTQKAYCQTASDSKLRHHLSVSNTRMRGNESPYKKMTQSNKKQTLSPTKTKYLIDLSISKEMDELQNSNGNVSSLFTLKEMSGSYDKPIKRPKRISLDPKYVKTK